MLVDVLVGHDLALQLSRRVVAVIAACGLLRGIIHEAVRQNALHAIARDLAGGEGVALDHGRRLAQHDRYLLRHDLPTIERSELAELSCRRCRADAMAEIILAA